MNSYFFTHKTITPVRQQARDLLYNNNNNNNNN